jgi:hypothetical protein
VVGVTSLIITFGLARRDHADRSIEFWLSLPVGHTRAWPPPCWCTWCWCRLRRLRSAGLAGGYVLVAAAGDTLCRPGRLVCPALGRQWCVPSKNCSSSVEPFSAAVEACASMVVVTASK